MEEIESIEDEFALEEQDGNIIIGKFQTKYEISTITKKFNIVFSII